MAKKDYIDFSEDRLLDMAAAFIDDHNYIGALKMLHKNAETNYADDRTFMMYAEIYDDLDMYEECINNWFKYIDCSEDPDLGEAYEGLAISFMQLDNEHFSAYYYNKMLIETENLSAEGRKEIIDNFLIREKNPLSFAYPPEKADYTADITEGVGYIKEHEPEKAAECFERVPEGNKRYLLARNYMAMGYLMCDMEDKAEEECNHILSKYPGNVQALTSLAAVRTEQKRFDEAHELAERLVALKTTEPDEIYKIATVCCENKMHRQAYDLFCKLENEVSRDRNLLYFKAISAYNCGEYEACFDTFDTLLTLFPDAVVAEHNYGLVREYVDSGNTEEMNYFYRVPKEMRDNVTDLLTAIYTLPRKEVNGLCRDLDISGSIKWCFDENESSEDNEMHYVATMCAVKAGYDNIVRDILLNAFLPDTLKLATMRALCERNESNQFGIVICNLYSCVDIYRLNIGRLKRKYFVEAYAILVSRFGILEESYSSRFAHAAESVYEKLEKSEALNLCKDAETIAAVILTESGVRETKVEKFDVCDFFNADKRRYSAITDILQQQ